MPTYLDEQGNEVKTYLDEQGNPVMAPASREQVDVSFAPSTATDEELHRANVRAEREAYQPSYAEALRTGGGIGAAAEMGRGVGEAIMGTTARIGGMVKGLAGMAGEFFDPAQYKSIAENPIIDLPGKIGAGLITGITEPLISPRTTGKAIGAPEAYLPVGIGKGIKAARSYVKGAPGRALVKGTQQIKAGLKPSMRTAEAIDASRDNFIQHIKTTGAEITDSASAAKAFGDATDSFYQTNYAPLANEIRAVPVQFQGATTNVEALLARRAELNDTLGRIGYYDKNPQVQAYARTAPQTAKILDEQEAVRAALNKAVDDMTPTNVGAAKILRDFADMKQVSDVAQIRAKRIRLAKDIKAGESETVLQQLSQSIKETPALLVTLGVKPALIASWTRAMVSGLKEATKVDPDVLFARGAQNWLKGSSKISPTSVERVPIPMRGAPPVAPGQAELPFAPPGVGAMGSELPLEPGPPRAIQMPNELTRQFSQALGEAKPPDVAGQYQLPIVPPGGASPAGVGTLPMGKQGLAGALESLTPARQREILPGPPEPYTPTLFRGDVKGGYRLLDPAQQAEKQRAILGKPYIDADGNVKYSKGGRFPLAQQRPGERGSIPLLPPKKGGLAKALEGTP